MAVPWQDRRVSGSAAAPGWYPDPWDPRSVRWFDGVSWTPQVAPVGAPPVDVYDGEKGAKTATWAGWAFLGRSVFTGVQYIAMPIVFGRFWDEVETATTTQNAAPFSGFEFGGFITLTQLGGLAVWVALAFLCVWSFRSTRNARALGLTTRFEPAWAVAGWLIPVANLAMPFMTVRDVFPEGHPGRRAAGFWWATEIAGIVVGTVAMFIGFVGTGIGAGVGAVAAAVVLAAGIQGWRLTRSVIEVHAGLARAAGLA